MFVDVTLVVPVSRSSNNACYLVDEKMMGRFQSVLTWICAGASSAILAHMFVTTCTVEIVGNPPLAETIELHLLCGVFKMTDGVFKMTDGSTNTGSNICLNNFLNIQNRLTVWRERDITYSDYFRFQAPIEHLQFKCSLRDQESRPDGIILANSTLCGTCTFTEAETDGHHRPLALINWCLSEYAAEPVVLSTIAGTTLLQISPDQHKRLNTARMSRVYDYL